MATATVGILRVLLSANTAEFESGMKRAAESALTRTLTLPIVAAFGGAAKAAMDFESSFANVAKTVDGVSDRAGVLTKEGRALAATFRQMAKEIPATTDELNAIAALGGQMGVPIKQLGAFTKNVAALGVAVDGISTEEAAAGLAQIGNITGQGTANVDKMASALVHLGNSSNATEGDILEFTKRLAGAGHAVGMTVPEVMALGTAMANVGINAEAGGTAMSTVISKISKAVSSGGDAMKEFAKVADMSGADFAAVWKRSPIEAIDAFVRGLSSMRERGVDLNLTMGELGTEGIRVADTLKRLAGAGDGVGKSLVIANEGFSAGNKHLEEAEKKYATTANQVKILWNHIKDIGITIGNSLLPAIKSSISLIQTLLPVVDGLAKGFAAMPGPLQALVVGMGLAVAAAGPMIWTFGTLLRSAGDITAAFTKKGIAARGLASAYGALAGPAASAAKWFGTIATYARTAALLTAGLSAALVGIVVPVALIILSDRLKRIREDAEAIIGASELVGKPVNNAAEARALLAAQEAGAKGRIFKPQPFEPLTTDQAKVWRDAKGPAEAYEGVVVKIGQAQLQTNQQLKIGAGLTVEGAQAILKASGVATQYVGGVLQISNATKSAGAATNLLKEAQEALTAADKQYNAELKNKRDVLAFAIRHMDALGMKTDDIAKKYGVSEVTVNRFKNELEESVKSSKKAETAAEKLAAALEKQRDALQKLGIVTATTVNEALSDYGTLVKHASDAGVPLDRILAALLPKLQDLSELAHDSGVSVTELDDALQLATRSADRLARDGFERIRASLPTVVSGLSEIPGELIEMDRASFGAITRAKLLTESFHAFGLKTRAELEQTARDAVMHFNFIKASGTATPEQIAEAFEKMQAAIRAASNETVKFGAILKSNLLQVMENLPQTLASAFTGGGGLKGAAQAIATQLGAAIGGSIGQAVGGPLGKKIGEALGSLLGPLVGKLFKEESRHINDLRDEFLSSFGPGGFGSTSGFNVLAKQLAALGKEGEQAFQKLIRASSQKEWDAALKNVNMLLGQQREEFTRLAAAGGVASKQLIAFRDATRDTAETIAFIKSETNTAAASFTSYLQAGATAYEKLKGLQKEYADASEQDRDKIAAASKEQEALIKAVGISSQQAASGMGAALAATFAELRNQGVPIREALAQLAPGIAAFKAQLEATGLSGGAAFDQIAHFAGIAAGTISGPALDAIGMLSRGLQGAHNAGFLTQEMFAGLVGEIMESRQAIIDQGASAEDVNRLMQGDLQAIWQLQKDFGYEVDDATQLLLDEAEAAGVVGDKYRSAMDRAALAMERVALALEEIIRKGKGLGTVLDEATKPRTVKVGFDVDRDGIPGREGVVPDVTTQAATGGLVTRNGIQYRGLGGPINWTRRGTDTVPAMLTPGELILNEGQQGNIGEALQLAMRGLQSGAFDMARASGVSPVTDAGQMTVGPFVMNIPPGELARVMRDGGPIVVEAWATEVRRGGDSRTRVMRALDMEPV
jgi:TP901 family phage tail tape measure protein